MGTPYLETYLQRRASQSEDKVAALDMLWKHYEKNNNFTAAARILSQLSQRHGSVIFYWLFSFLCGCMGHSGLGHFVVD